MAVANVPRHVSAFLVFPYIPVPVFATRLLHMGSGTTPTFTAGGRPSWLSTTRSSNRDLGHGRTIEADGTLDCRPRFSGGFRRRVLLTEDWDLRLAHVAHQGPDVSKADFACVAIPEQDGLLPSKWCLTRRLSARRSSHAMRVRSR
jgi:hypothetical protein